MRAHTTAGRLVATFGAWLALAVAAGAQTHGPSEAPPAPPVTWATEVDVVSQYVWRGFPYSEGVAVWPTFRVSARGLTASLFLNYDPNWNPGWNEYDLTFTYERAVRRWTFAGSYVRYVYYEGDQKDATSEVIGRVEFALGPGRIVTTHAFDVESYKGSYYLEAGYATVWKPDSKSTVAIDGCIAFWSSFIDEYTAGTATHITDGSVGPIILNLAYARTIGPGVKIRPHVSFIHIGDADARRSLDPPGITGGVAIVVGR